MQETLQDRLQREAREKYSRAIAKNAMGYEELEDIISQTITETIKAGVGVNKEEIEHWKKHSAGNYADGAIEALQTAVTKLQELNKTNGL